MNENSRKNLKVTPENQFTSDKQPTGAAKSAGKKRKRLLKDIGSQLVQGKSKDALSSLALYLGVEVDQIDIETAMHLKQIELAIKEGDTRAYNAVMDRLNGKPLQQVEDVTPKDSTIKIQVID